MPTLKDIMTRTVITAREADSLLYAQRVMLRNNITRLVVIDDKNLPIGIMTQKDMVRGLVKSESGKSLGEIPVKAMMTKNPISLEAGEDIKEAARKMLSRKISSIIVVDRMAKTVGIVTKSDFCRYLSGISETGILVRRFMSKNPVTIGQDHSIFAAAHVMSDRGFTRLVVTDANNKPIGIVTLSDLVSVGAVLTSPTRYSGLSIVVRGALIPSRMLPILLVRNIMTVDPFTVDQDADITDAARSMTRHGISGLPAVDERGNLVGIITKTDLVKAVSKVK